MRIKTKPYGEIDVDERQRIYFPSGILGFEHMKDYVLLDAIQQPFYWLQSLDMPEIAFVLINPKIFKPEYQVEILSGELEEINLVDRNSEDILLFAIVTIPDNQNKMTANLQGPIIINRTERLGRQSISTNPEWKVRHLILEELAKVRNEAC